MTPIGINRQRYSEQVEPAPSRFQNPSAYHAWAARADAWAQDNA